MIFAFGLPNGRHSNLRSDITCDWIRRENSRQPFASPHFNFFRGPEHDEGRKGGATEGAKGFKAVALIEPLGAGIVRINDQPTRRLFL
jgi:hypothetical protein